MRENKKYNDKFILYVSLLFFFVVTIIICGVHFPFFHNESAVDINWVITKHEDKTILKMEAPISFEKDSILALRPNYNKVIIRNNDKVIFEYATDKSIFHDNTKIIGNPVLSVLLNKDEKNDIEIEYFESRFDFIPRDIKIYDNDSFYSNAFRQIIPSFFISNVFLFLSFVCFIFYFYSRKKNKIFKSKEIIYFSIFSLLCSIGGITSNALLPVFIKETEWILFLNFLSFLLLVPSFLLLIGEFLQKKTNGYYVLLYAQFLHVFLSIFCHVTGIYSLIETSVMTCMLCLICICYLIYKNYQSNQESIKIEFSIINTGLIGFLLFFLASLLIFYFQKDISSSICYVLGIGFLYICMLFLSLHKIYESFLKLKNMEFLQKQAYQDRLTDTFNRSSYIADVNKLSGPIALFVININSLKTINNTRGHKAGDELIKRSSDILECVFKRDGGKIYRFGGDEFVVIVPRMESIKYMDAIKYFLQKANSDETIQLSFSIGYAMANLECPSYEKVQKVLEEADKMMYKEKEKFYTIHDRRKKRSNSKK